MAQEFGGQVRFVVENYGDSKLAKRFGVDRYPAIFVNDILVATPNDFGFFGKGKPDGAGRYSPLRSAEAHARFRSDLEKMLRLVLAGRTGEARSIAPAQSAVQIAALPALNVIDIHGNALTPEQLAGRVVIVEFWATWCPPCRSTLAWLGGLSKKYGKDVAIVTVAVESDKQNVEQIVQEMRLPMRAVIGTPELARAFGDISAVPTLFVFDRTGKTAGVFYGAPPTLHADAEKTIERARG